MVTSSRTLSDSACFNRFTLSNMEQMNKINTNEILFITTFLSKFAFAVLFGVGTFLIYGHRGENGDVTSNNLVLSCGGDESYFALDTTSCVYYGSSDMNRCDIWYDYNGVNITEPWDEKVVQCMYNVRGGLFTAATVFFVFSIILEDPRVKTANRKFYLLMKMLHALGGLFLFGSVVSEMDIMKRLSSYSSIYIYEHYARFFVLKYPDISNILWIIGTLITMICEIYLGRLHILHTSSVLKRSTYIMAALGSFFLFVAGTIRNHTVAEKIFPNNSYGTFYISAKIFPLMLIGTVLFLCPFFTVLFCIL